MRWLQIVGHLLAAWWANSLNALEIAHANLFFAILLLLYGKLR